MKAIVLTKFGAPDSLVVRDIAAPTKMLSGDLYIRQKAIGVNMVDLKMRSTEFDLKVYNIKNGIIGLDV